MTIRQRPTRSPGGRDDYVEEHPAYAVIGASRVESHPGEPLFGSDFLHRGYVVIRIQRAQLRRGLSQDWVGSTGRELIEVALSEAQWATFLSTLNRGDGVPCTLRWFEESIPGIEPDTDRLRQHRQEIDETLRDALFALDELAVLIESGGRKAALRDAVAKARRELRSNLPFVARSFDEHAEQTVERAKVEVAAYIARTIERAGLQALGGAAPILELPEGSEDEQP